MKVFFDHQIFCLQSYGGPSRYYVELVNELKKIEKNIVVSAPFNINEHLKEVEKKYVLGNKVFFSNKIDKSYRLKKNFLKFNNFLNYFIIKYYDPEIIHFTYFDDLISKNKKIKKIVTVYDLIHELFHKDYGKDNNNLPKKNILDACDKIICISENTKKDLIDIYKINEDKIHVTYLSANLNKIKFSKNLFDFPYISYIGSRWKYKNFKNFLIMISKNQLFFKDYKFIFFGGGNLNIEEKKLINELGINPNSLIFLSGDDKFLNTLLFYSELMIYPSLYEGFGLPILEAFKNSCPVVCSNIKAFKEVGGEAVEYFNPKDTDDMFFQLKKVLNSVSLRKKMIENGSNRLKLFSWEKCATETMQIYNEI